MLLENELLLEQRQVLTGKQLQSLEILTFTNQELDAFLANEYLENPMLEPVEDGQEEPVKNLEQVYEQGATYKEQYTQWGDEECSRKGDLRAAGPDEVEEFLLGQLNAWEYAETEWQMMKYLIQCLDEQGFFPYDPEALAEELGVSDRLMDRCLKRLKDLEPAGIFSRDVSECLLQQLERLDVREEGLLCMVRDHMQEVLQGQLCTVARSLGVSTAKVKEYINRVSSLNPRPVMHLGTGRADYVVPDLLVVFEKGRWEAAVNDRWMGEYRFNDYYIRMMEQAEDADLKQYFREKLDRARFLISCVEQRRKTLTSITEAVFAFQEDYFLNGGDLKPMTMEDIARRTNLHVSTVSRAIRDKYVQYHKTCLLRDLFTAAAQAQDAVSVVSVKAQIRAMIEQEDTSAPLSDAAVAKRMKEAGIRLSRRTVAKYRMQMGIPESRHRLYLEKRI